MYWARCGRVAPAAANANVIIADCTCSPAAIELVRSNVPAMAPPLPEITVPLGRLDAIVADEGVWAAAGVWQKTVKANAATTQTADERTCPHEAMLLLPVGPSAV